MSKSSIPKPLFRFVIPDREEFSSLLEYVATMLQAIIDTPPVGYDAPVECRRLAGETLQLMLQCIHMLDDFFSARMCIVGLCAANIVVSTWSLEPKLAAGVKLTEKWSRKLQAKNMRRLAEIFRRDILKGARPPPPEVEHLLRLMSSRHSSVKMMYLIKNHPCFVPMSNRTIYTTRLVECVWGELFNREDRAAFDHVMENLVYPRDWHLRVRRNKHMLAFYGDRDYDPEGTKRPAGVTVPALEVLKYNYNSSMDGIKHAVDVRAPHGMLFGWKDMGHMLYSVFDMVLASTAESLHRLGSSEGKLGSAATLEDHGFGKMSSNRLR
ncbi:hypothetical protein EJB05_44100, partial [Eragrostis curvula]